MRIMYCVDCGKEIKDGARFCPYCGAGQQIAATVTEQEYPDEKKAKSPSVSAQDNGLKMQVPVQSGGSVAVKRPPAVPILIVVAVAIAVILVFVFDNQADKDGGGGVSGAEGDIGGSSVAAEGGSAAGTGEAGKQLDRYWDLLDMESDGVSRRFNIILEAQSSGNSDDQMIEAKQIMMDRIAKAGVPGISIIREGDNRIRIDFSGTTNQVNKILYLIGRTGQFQLLTAGGDTILNNNQVVKCWVEKDKERIGYVVATQVNEDGAKSFYDATLNAYNGNVEGPYIDGVTDGCQIVLMMDGDLLNDPYVNGPIEDGNFIITSSNGLSEEDAYLLALLASSKSLPLAMTEVESFAINENAEISNDETKYIVNIIYTGRINRRQLGDLMEECSMQTEAIYALTSDELGRTRLMLNGSGKDIHQLLQLLKKEGCEIGEIFVND